MSRLRDILLNCINTASERISMIRFQPVAAPVTQECFVGHVQRVVAGHLAREVVHFQRRQAGESAFIVDQLKKFFAGERNRFTIESAALNGSLAKRNRSAKKQGGTRR